MTIIPAYLSIPRMRAASCICVTGRIKKNRVTQFRGRPADRFLRGLALQPGCSPQWTEGKGRGGGHVTPSPLQSFVSSPSDSRSLCIYDKRAPVFFCEAAHLLYKFLWLPNI